MVHSIPRPFCVPTTGQTPESSVINIMTKGHTLGWAGLEAAFLALKLQQISVSYTEHRSKDHNAWSIEAFDHKCFGALPEFSVYTDYSVWAKFGPANNWLLDRTSSGPAAIAFCQIIFILFSIIPRLNSLSVVLAVKFPNIFKVIKSNHCFDNI